MKVIITGGSGFIGSHVVDEVLAAGHDVVIYDTEAPRFGQKCGYVRGDIRDIDRLSATARGADVIYNLAAEANVNRFFESPIYSNEVTSHGTLCVLEVCPPGGELPRDPGIDGMDLRLGGRLRRTNRSPKRHPYSQSPDHLYTSSKIAAELFCKNYQRLYAVPYTIMRFGIPFGERARPETVTPIFIRRLLNNEPITIHGDGSQTPAVHLCEGPGPWQRRLSAGRRGERDLQSERHANRSP